MRPTVWSHSLVKEKYALLNDEILPKLAEEGIVFLRRSAWTVEQREWIKDYFFREVMPVLTPIGLDPSHPFPRVLNKSLNFAVELKGKDAFGRSSGAAIVQAPESCRASSGYHVNCAIARTALCSSRRSCMPSSVSCLPA